MIYAAGLCSDLISFCNNISSTSFYLCNPMCIKLPYYCTSSVSNYKSLQLFESQTIYIFDQNYRKDYNSERRVLIRVVDYIQTLIFLRQTIYKLSISFLHLSTLNALTLPGHTFGDCEENRLLDGGQLVHCSGCDWCPEKKWPAQ